MLTHKISKEDKNKISLSMESHKIFKEDKNKISLLMEFDTDDLSYMKHD